VHLNKRDDQALTMPLIPESALVLAHWHLKHQENQEKNKPYDLNQMFKPLVLIAVGKKMGGVFRC